jgi:hypothetical protein
MNEEIYICESCESEQSRLHEEPRELYEIDLANGLMNKTDPIYLCYYCDGDAFDMTIENLETKKK